MITKQHRLTTKRNKTITNRHKKTRKNCSKTTKRHKLMITTQNYYKETSKRHNKGKQNHKEKQNNHKRTQKDHRKLQNNKQMNHGWKCSAITHLMSSSVTMKALHSGWAVLSQTPGFFSTAADSWPVMGAALVCRALAIADKRVLSVQPGPTPEGPKNQPGDLKKTLKL